MMLGFRRIAWGVFFVTGCLASIAGHPDQATFFACLSISICVASLLDDREEKP